jgi:hypothetical protein
MPSPADRLVDRLPAGRRGVARLLVALLVVSLTGLGAADTATYEEPRLQPGTVESPAAGDTVVSIQGYNIGGQVNPNKPARLVSVDPRGEEQWLLDRTDLNASWFYDVDPLPDGDLLLVGTFERQTRVFRLDGDSRTVEWQETLPLWDTHDVTLTADDNLLVANMRNTNNGTSDDRVFVYNRTTDTVEWEWLFREHYPHDTDNGVSAGDWSHVNDVDVISEGLYMLSPRNFDQVVVVNRSTGDIVMRLGADGEHAILDEQHNPAYLQTEAGAPTFLVADSENDRVVEYTCDNADPDHPLDGDMEPNCDWNLTWSVGDTGLEWPRDADRLPDGNTLVVDTLNHRVVEITPRGEVVWEYEAPWLPFDAERPVHGREAGGPTMRDLNVTGNYSLVAAGASTPTGGSSPTWVPGHAVVTDLGETVRGVLPWVRPVWMPPGAFFLFGAAGLLLLGWGGAELVLARARLRRRLAALLGRERPG